MNFLTSLFTFFKSSTVEVPNVDGKGTKSINVFVFGVIFFLLMYWILYKLKVKIPNPFKKKTYRRRRRVRSYRRRSRRRYNRKRRR